MAPLIKLSNNFFLVGWPLFWIFNPAVYILIEGLLCSIITISFGIIFYRKNSKWILFPGMEENEQYEI